MHFKDFNLNFDLVWIPWFQFPVLISEFPTNSTRKKRETRRSQISQKMPTTDWGDPPIARWKTFVLIRPQHRPVCKMVQTIQTWRVLNSDDVTVLAIIVFISTTEAFSLVVWRIYWNILRYFLGTVCDETLEFRL